MSVRLLLDGHRVEHLLDDAVAFRRARDIRAYVDEARAADAGVPDPLSSVDMEVWAR